MGSIICIKQRWDDTSYNQGEKKTSLFVCCIKKKSYLALHIHSNKNYVTVTIIVKCGFCWSGIVFYIIYEDHWSWNVGLLNLGFNKWTNTTVSLPWIGSCNFYLSVVCKIVENAYENWKVWNQLLEIFECFWGPLSTIIQKNIAPVKVKDNLYYVFLWWCLKKCKKKIGWQNTYSMHCL